MFHRDSLACTSEIAGPCLTKRSMTIKMPHSILTQQHQFAVVVSCASAVGTSELDNEASNASTTKQFPAPLRFMIDAGNARNCSKVVNSLLSVLSGMSRFNLSCVFCFMVYCGHTLLFLCVLLHVSLFDKQGLFTSRNSFIFQLKQLKLLLKRHSLNHNSIHQTARAKYLLAAETKSGSHVFIMLRD